MFSTTSASCDCWLLKRVTFFGLQIQFKFFYLRRAYTECGGREAAAVVVKQKEPPRIRNMFAHWKVLAFMYRWPSGKFNNSSLERFSAHVPTAHTSRHYVRFSWERSRGHTHSIHINIYEYGGGWIYSASHFYSSIEFERTTANMYLTVIVIWKYVLSHLIYLFVTEGDFFRRCSARSESNRRKMSSQKVNCNSLQKLWIVLTFFPRTSIEWIMSHEYFPHLLSDKLFTTLNSKRKRFKMQNFKSQLNFIAPDWKK